MTTINTTKKDIIAQLLEAAPKKRVKKEVDYTQTAFYEDNITPNLFPKTARIETLQTSIKQRDKQSSTDAHTRIEYNANASATCLPARLIVRDTEVCTLTTEGLTIRLTQDVRQFAADWLYKFLECMTGKTYAKHSRKPINFIINNLEQQALTLDEFAQIYDATTRM